MIAHIGNVRLTKVDGGTLNGLYAHLLANGRRRPSRTGRGYSSQVVERALELRADGLTLGATAERLRVELVRPTTSPRTRWPACSAAMPTPREPTPAHSSTGGPSTTSTRSSTGP